MNWRSLSLWFSGQRVNTQRLRRMRFRPPMTPLESQKGEERIFLKMKHMSKVQQLTVTFFSCTGSFITWSHAALCDRRPSSCQHWLSSRRSWATCRLSWATRSRATCSPSTEQGLHSHSFVMSRAEEENCSGHLAHVQMFMELDASSLDSDLGSVCVCYPRPISDSLAVGHLNQ